jgi:acetyltransferase-like isoleucine patch superfamily enzyme
MSYDLGKLGSVGQNVQIHESALIFNPEYVHIGHDVRVDCFVVISASENGVFVGNNVHVAAMVQIVGSGGRVTVEDFVSISSRATIYTSADDFSGNTLTGPTVPMHLRGVRTGPVTLRKHVVVGCGTIVMPNTELGVGSAVGALTFVNESVPPFAIVAGTPMKKIADRSRSLLDLEIQYEREKANHEPNPETV